MNSRRRIGTIASSACAVLLLCAAADEPEQTIHKQVDAEGRTTFSDQPPPARRSTIAPRRGGKVDVSEAARRLEQAQLARKQGLEPNPGEYIRVSGTPTPNFRYWQRQEKLRLTVEQAQRRSQDTQRHAGGRNVLRASLGS